MAKPDISLDSAVFCFLFLKFEVFYSLARFWRKLWRKSKMLLLRGYKIFFKIFMDFIILALYGALTSLFVSKSNFNRVWDFVFGVLGAVSMSGLVLNFKDGIFATLIPIIAAVATIYTGRLLKSAENQLFEN